MGSAISFVYPAFTKKTSRIFASPLSAMHVKNESEEIKCIGRIRFDAGFDDEIVLSQPVFQATVQIERGTGTCCVSWSSR